MSKKLKQYLKWYFIGISVISLILFNIDRFADIPKVLVYGIYLSFTALLISLYRCDDTNYKETNINSNNEIKCM